MTSGSDATTTTTTTTATTTATTTHHPRHHGTHSSTTAARTRASATASATAATRDLSVVPPNNPSDSSNPTTRTPTTSPSPLASPCNTSPPLPNRASASTTSTTLASAVVPAAVPRSKTSISVSSAARHALSSSSSSPTLPSSPPPLDLPHTATVQHHHSTTPSKITSSSPLPPPPLPPPSPPRLPLAHPAPPPGLFNLGNTCYLNSVLQILYHIPDFRQQILAWNGLPKSIPISDTLSFAADLVHALRIAFESLQSAHRKADKYIQRKHSQNDLQIQHTNQEQQSYHPPSQSPQPQPQNVPPTPPQPPRILSSQQNVWPGRSPKTYNYAAAKSIDDMVVGDDDDDDDVDWTGSAENDDDDDLDDDDDDEDDDDEDDDDDDDEDDDEDEDEDIALSTSKKAPASKDPESSKTGKLKPKLKPQTRVLPNTSNDGVVVNNLKNASNGESNPPKSLSVDEAINGNLATSSPAPNVSNSNMSNVGLDVNNADGNKNTALCSSSSTHHLNKFDSGSGFGSGMLDGLSGGLNDIELKDGVDYVEPQELISLLRNEQRCIEFDARGQQDAHEFLRFLLDKVNDCMKACESFRLEQLEKVKKEKAEKEIAEKEKAEKERLTERATRKRRRAKNFQATGNGDDNCAGNPTVDEDRAAKKLKCKTGSSVVTRAKRRRCEMELEPSNNKSTEDLPGKERDDGVEDTISPDVRMDEKESEEEKRNDMIRELFGGEAVTMTRCEECEKITQRGEDFLDISLPVQADKSLSWALSSHGEAEELKGDNKYMCETCHTYCEAKRWLKLSKLPKVITMHLKLFAFDNHSQLYQQQAYPYSYNNNTYRMNGGYASSSSSMWNNHVSSNSGGAKVSVAMPCPLRMKLSDWCSDECAQRDDEYRLSGVIVHEGTGANCGHYYSFVSNTNGDGWYCCDDSIVSWMSEDEMTSLLFSSTRSRRTAYVLFYTHYSSPASPSS